MKLQNTFKNPGVAYRGKPFWAWNGALEPEELRRQIRVFERMGLGGFFMHSRVGLATPYLGQKWFECIDACIDEAVKLGQEAWLYDEDRWPSGSAGGLITQKKARHRMRYLALKIFSSAAPSNTNDDQKIIGVWQARFENNKLYDLERLSEGSTAAPGFRLLVASIEETTPHPWYNLGTYLDTLSKEAVAEFIKVTHERYREHYGLNNNPDGKNKDRPNYFGNVIPGIFTDEPNMGAFGLQAWVDLGGGMGAAIPWTPKMIQVFRKRYGYDLTNRIPELFLDVDGVDYSRARRDYRDCATHLFVEAFSKQIGEWCEKNNLLFTGHVLFEEPLNLQTQVVGAAMRFYEHMQAPGVDILTQFAYEYDTVKQCESVAHQTGRKWVLSELYGCTGWDLSFEGHKAVGDWQAALGVNLRCPHLSWYTMKAEAKRDYPASISFQSAWAPYYHAVEDYFSRVGVMITQGKPIRRVLMIHPIESFWLRYRPDLIHEDGHVEAQNTEEINKLCERFQTVRNGMLNNHFDFDYGDEEMLVRLASVKKSGRLVVGQASYDAVVVPPLLSIRASTLDLLKQIRASGGRVIFAGEIPSAVDAVYSDKVARLAEKCVCVDDADGLVTALEKLRTISIKNQHTGEEIAPALYMLRRDGDNQIVFICNTDRAQNFEAVQIKIEGQGTITEWDPTTGERSRIVSASAGGWVQFTTTLPATGSRIFMLSKESESELESLPIRHGWHEERRMRLEPTAGAVLSEPNVLVLDRPSYCFDGDNWQEPMEILKVDQALRSKLGLLQRGGAMVQPWARKTDKNEKTTPIILRYKIQVETQPGGPLYLAMETPERFKVTLNGVELFHEPTQDGWWVDPCLCRLPIDPAILQIGNNELLLKLDFVEADSLEAIYLLGGFGVTLEGCNPKLVTPSSLNIGDATLQGLPFYGAGLTYRFRADLKSGEWGESLFLSAPNFQGAVARVLIDGKEVGFLSWAPYEFDLTPWAHLGNVEIAIQVIVSRRNTFGPLHITQPEPPWIGPESFISGGDLWQEAYSLKPSGLLEAPELIWRRPAE